jgi:hypothetical protein
MVSAVTARVVPMVASLYQKGPNLVLAKENIRSADPLQSNHLAQRLSQII